MYMKYKLLKLIEPKENSISIWGTFDSIWGFVHLDNWLQLSVELLIEQGFIEEVKETPKPRWKVGDKVVDCENRFLEIFSVSKKDDPRMYNEIYTGQWFFWCLERDLREPTPEELTTYFK